MTGQPFTVEFEATARGPIDDPYRYRGLPVTNVVASMDMDRVPYCAATFTLQDIKPAVWAALEPRRSSISETDGNLTFRMVRRDAEGNVIDYLGQQEAGAFVTVNTPLELHTRNAQRDYVTGETTVNAAGPEMLLDDRRRIATNDIDTNATTVADLVSWALIDTFGAIVISEDTLALTTALPAGDRRMMRSGETFNELIETELDALGLRLYSFWGRTWYVNQREVPPMVNRVNSHIVLSTHTAAEGAPEFADPIVFGITETLSRDGDYADGVLARYDTTKIGGGVTSQRSGNGDNTKGRVITSERPMPGENAANVLVGRTRIRGQEFTVECSIRFDITPGMMLTVYTREGVVAGSIRAVSWDAAAGTMTIRAQSGRPLA